MILTRVNASVSTASPKIESIILDSGETAIRIGVLEVRPGSRQALSDRGRVQLTGRELEVLMILVEQPDRVVPREVMYRQVWGGVMPNRDRAIDTYVRRVREKLAVLTPEIAHIHTHFGIGYRFWPQPTPQA